MEFSEMVDRAIRIRHRYTDWEQAAYGRAWTREEVALGFVGDVGDMMRLIQAREGVRAVPEAESRLAHELADCLWSILVLAHLYDVDLEQAFQRTMDDLERHLTPSA